jgi:hypothetical protein
MGPGRACGRAAKAEEVSDWHKQWIWIRIRVGTISAARAALSILGLQLHNEARIEYDKKRQSHLRAEGDHYVDEERHLQEAEMRGKADPPA